MSPSVLAAWERFGPKTVRTRLPVLLSISSLLVLTTSAIFAEHIAPYPMNYQNLREVLLPPFWLPGGSGSHILGTDRLGRDVLTEIIFGARVSLTVGIGAVLLGLMIGVPIGMISGYFRGAVDKIFGRLIDVQLSLPLIFVALLLVMLVGPGKNNVIIVQGLAGWLIYARLARGQVLVQSQLPYIEAARGLGSSWPRTLLRELLPNIRAPVIAISTLEVGRNIITETTLSFLGVGVTPPDASWGRMIADGRDVIFVAWWVPTWPGIAITLTVIAFALTGDWLLERIDRRRG